MALTYESMTGDGTLVVDRDYQAGDDWGYLDATQARQAIKQAKYVGYRFDLGGEDATQVTSSWQAIRRGTPQTIQFDNLGGLDHDAIFYLYTTDAGTSVQLRIWNETDSSVLVASSVKTDLTVQEQIVTITTPPNANKKYVLQIQGGNTDAGVVGWAYIRSRKLP